MNPEIADLSRRVAAFEREAHRIFQQLEAAPSRVISLAETRKQIGILNLKQSKLLEEAVTAAEHGLYRPAIVMSWAAFMDFLEEKVASDGFISLLAVRPKWTNVQNLDDLRDNFTEHAILEASYAMKVLRKPEHKTLQGLLSKRNECAHPTGYEPNLNEALGYISELLNRIPTVDQRTV